MGEGLGRQGQGEAGDKAQQRGLGNARLMVPSRAYPAQGLRPALAR